MRLGKRANIRVVCKTSDTLRNRLVKFKPKQSTNKEVIYSIPCECGKEYIGETGRPLLTRVKEHKAALKKGETISSKLVEHAWEMDHNFMWDEAKAIGRESNWKARKFHEALEIYLGGDRVISAPSMDLDPVWYPTLDDLKKSRNKKSTMTTNYAAPLASERSRNARGWRTPLLPPRLLNDFSDLVRTLVTLELQPVGHRTL
jgi:predicted GIY-YIG superfamily endonuclease